MEGEGVVANLPIFLVARLDSDTVPRLMRRTPQMALALSLLAANAAAEVEPWSDPDPADAAERQPIGDGTYGFRAGAEYRAQALYIHPLSLNTETDRNASWVEHRLRLDGAFDYEDKVKIVSSVDLLDGVVWGDNGTLLAEPFSNSGIGVNTKSPNATRPCISYHGTGDPLDARGYGWGLCSQDQVRIRRLYGEVITPIGALRIGRQPVGVGAALQQNDGDGRRNRFGVARSGQSVDRVMFATKPLEGFKPEEERNRSADEGFFVVLAYDRLVTDDLRTFGDDVHQSVFALRLLEPEYSAGEDLEILSFWTHRWDEQYSTRINAFGLRALSRFGDFYAGIEAAANIGSTREIAEAYNAITNDPVVDQPIRQLGARAVIRYDQPTWTAYFEADYASGDEDPQARTPLSQFTWAEDTNVGLLMFEHTLGFQSARAAAAGVEVLKRLGAASYPTEAIDTRGAFTNAFAIFPQFDYRPHPNILLRGGVLMAWAPSRVVDPVKSLLLRDGVTIEDDLVNFAGGKPGNFYGTELDGRFQWRFEEHFAFDLEGAILFPGDAFQDVNGDAVRSVLVQGRTTFFF